jgi:hypothetical protein
MYEKQIEDLKKTIEGLHIKIEKLVVANANVNKDEKTNEDFVEAKEEKLNAGIPAFEIAEEDEPEIAENNSLVINNTTIISRSEDNYINATQLCQAGGKQFAQWFRLDTTKELINALSFNVGIPILDLVEAKKGGKHSGSWIHPDLGIQLAQWINPTVALQVSGWIRTLFSTGKVEIKIKQLKEKKREIEVKDKIIKTLESKHNKLLQKRSYHKFKTGPAFYIISDGDSKSIKYKPGIDDFDINVRLAQHRSTTPSIKLEFLIYTDKNGLIEKAMLEKYRAQRDFQNHEWIFDIDVSQIISSVRTLIDFLVIEHTEEGNLVEYNSQISEVDE